MDVLQRVHYRGFDFGFQRAWIEIGGLGWGLVEFLLDVDGHDLCETADAEMKERVQDDDCSILPADWGR